MDIGFHGITRLEFKDLKQLKRVPPTKGYSESFWTTKLEVEETKAGGIKIVSAFNLFSDFQGTLPADVAWLPDRLPTEGPVQTTPPADHKEEEPIEYNLTELGYNYTDGAAKTNDLTITAKRTNLASYEALIQGKRVAGYDLNTGTTIDLATGLGVSDVAKTAAALLAILSHEGLIEPDSTKATIDDLRMVYDRPW